MSRLTWSSAAAAAVLVFTSSPAAAGTTAGVVRVDGARVVYTAGGAVDNEVTILESGAAIVIDDVVPVKAGPGCVATRNDNTRVTCTASAPSRVSVSLGLGDDSFIGERYATYDTPARIDGGPGNDTIHGSWSDDTLIGGAGDDVLTGENGSDLIDAGPGDDQVTGDGRIFDSAASWSDTLHGGPGFDSLFWPETWEWLTVDLRGSEPGSGLNGGDIVTADFEGAETRAQMGTLIGNDADNVLAGGTDNVPVQGLGGNDTLTAWDGGADLYGGPGDDTLIIDQVGQLPGGAPNLLDGGDNATAAGDSCTTPFPAKDVLVGCER